MGTYSNIEVVLVDDGSRKQDAVDLILQLTPVFESRGWKVVRQDNLYLGAARNTGARHATGKYVMFMDDDNYAKPHEVETLVGVMERAAADPQGKKVDILTSFVDFLQGEKPPHKPHSHATWCYLGGALALGFYENVYGDANCFMRLETFKELGGYSEVYGVGYEDWEFYSAAELRNYTIQCVPDQLYWYRMTKGSMQDNTEHYANRMRYTRAFTQHVHPRLKQMMMAGLQLSTNFN